MLPKETYIQCTLELFQDFLSKKEKEELCNPNNSILEENGDLVYFEFVLTVIEKKLSRIILLVYNNQNQVIADTSILATRGIPYLTSQGIYDEMSEESDWCFLEHYVIGNMRYGALPYPACLHDLKEETLSEYEADTLLFVQNVYVTEQYRNHHIFSNMLDMVCDNAVQGMKEDFVKMFLVMSLDPDIACYGPDKKEETYYYSMEQDEPKRNVNKDILTKMGFDIIQVNLGVESKDGCKIWFAIKALDIFSTNNFTRA